jgi:hypothetical protein
MVNKKGIDDATGKTCFTNLHAEWQTEYMRKNLMYAVSDTLQALTSVPIGSGTNCFDLDGAKACNVGDTIRVGSAPHKLSLIRG